MRSAGTAAIRRRHARLRTGVAACISRCHARLRADIAACGIGNTRLRARVRISALNAEFHSVFTGSAAYGAYFCRCGSRRTAIGMAALNAEFHAVFTRSAAYGANFRVLGFRSAIRTKLSAERSAALGACFILSLRANRRLHGSFFRGLVFRNLRGLFFRGLFFRNLHGSFFCGLVFRNLHGSFFCRLVFRNLHGSFFRRLFFRNLRRNFFRGLIRLRGRGLRSPALCRRMAAIRTKLTFEFSLTIRTNHIIPSTIVRTPPKRTYT